MPTVTIRLRRRCLIRVMPTFLLGTDRVMRCESDQRHPSATMFARFSTCVMWKIAGFVGMTPGIQLTPGLQSAEDMLASFDAWHLYI